MTVEQINLGRLPFHGEHRPETDGLITQFRHLFWHTFQNTKFSAITFDGPNYFTFSIAFHVEHRSSPATTAGASLNAAIETVGDMSREPSIMWPRVMPLREYGPGSWSSFFQDATYEILNSVKHRDWIGFQRHHYDSVLCAGGKAKYEGNMYDCWSVKTLIKTPGHWSCIMLDTTAWYDPARDITAEYVLRTELLACVALLSRQLEQGQRTGSMDQRSLKATVVTMVPEGCRVIQAWCDPASPSPVIALTLRGTYDRNDPETGFTTESARNILRWILQPDEPWFPPSEVYYGSLADRESSGAQDAAGDRVVSNDSDKPQESRTGSIAAAEDPVESVAADVYLIGLTAFAAFGVVVAILTL